MLRFANNQPTVLDAILETELMVYIAKGGRRAIAATTNPREENLKSFVKDLFDSLGGLPSTEYAHLPAKAASYSVSSRDPKVLEAGETLPELAKLAIDTATGSGASRSAGVVTASEVSYAIRTSGGVKGVDARTSITLNIRSFSDGEASGHGLSCSATMAGFDAAEAGRRAGSAAKMMRGATQPEAGKYTVLMSPAVASNLIGSVANATSAFAVEAGLSYLTDKVGKKVAADCVTITDHGTVQGGLGGRSFDDEGSATGTTPLITKGILQGYLHNLTTASKWGASNTGNAGIIDPHPWNVEVSPGSEDYAALVKGIGRGIILTSNWYTRFKNYRTGEFSTVPRDGAYLVEGGEVKRSLKGMRMSDDLEHLFSSVAAVSKEREWVQWWEVDTPTLCPWVLAEGVGITRAYE
jgi:PmbA protein